MTMMSQKMQKGESHTEAQVEDFQVSGLYPVIRVKELSPDDSKAKNMQISHSS